MSRIQAAFVSIFLLFLTVVYVLAMVPTVENLLTVFIGTGVDAETQSNLELVEVVALYVVPTMMVGLALLFGYVSMASRSRFAGQRRRW